MARMIRQLVILVSLCVVFSGALFATTPSITSLSSASGAIGSSVTITGANFGTTQDTSTVTFNGTAATATGWSAGSIVVSVPPAATTGYVKVTVGGVVSNGVNFTVATATFTLTGSLATGRMFQTATLLNGGTVLVAGGVDGFQYLPISSRRVVQPGDGHGHDHGQPQHRAHLQHCNIAYERACTDRRGLG
jgi:hypothetical protein